MPQIGVAAVDLFLALLNRHVVLFGVVDSVLSGHDVPLAPRRNHGQVGGEGFESQFEANLVIALAGGTMRERVAIGFQRDLDLPLGD